MPEALMSEVIYTHTGASVEILVERVSPAADAETRHDVRGTCT